MHLYPPLFDAPARGIPSEFLDKTYTVKTRVMGLLYRENCMILTSTVFDWSTRVMDGQDRRTDWQAIAYSALSMLSRAKNWSQLCSYHFYALLQQNIGNIFVSFHPNLLSFERERNLPDHYSFFASLAPEEDHDSVITAALRPPTDWRRPVGRPRTTSWEQLMRMFSLRTLWFIHHGRRQEIGIHGNNSLVRQRSARSPPLRRIGLVEVGRLLLW